MPLLSNVNFPAELTNLGWVENKLSEEKAKSFNWTASLDYKMRDKEIKCFLHSQKSTLQEKGKILFGFNFGNRFETKIIYSEVSDFIEDFKTVSSLIGILLES